MNLNDKKHEDMEPYTNVYGQAKINSPKPSSNLYSNPND